MKMISSHNVMSVSVLAGVIASFPTHAATTNLIQFENSVLEAAGLTAISPHAGAGGGFTGSNIHGYAFQSGVGSSQLYSGTGGGALDYGVLIGAAGGVTGGSFSAQTYDGTTSFVSVGFATIYDTEIANLSGRNGNDPDLQRVERDGGEGGTGVQQRWSWGRTSGGVAAALGIGGSDTSSGTTLGSGSADRGNLGNVSPRYVTYGALIAQETGNGDAGFDANGFILAEPDDVTGSTIIFDIVDPESFGYQQVGFDFVDLDEVSGDDDVVVFIETTDGFVRRFSLAEGDIDGGLSIGDFGSSVDGGISRNNIPLNVRTTGNGFVQGTVNAGEANGDVTPTGSISRVIIDYQGISGAVGAVGFSTIPEPSTALVSLLGLGLMARRRR